MRTRLVQLLRIRPECGCDKVVQAPIRAHPTAPTRTLTLWMRLWPLVIVTVLRRLGPQVFGSSGRVVVMELAGSRLPPSAISLLACRLKALEDRWGVIWKGLSTF